MKNLQIILEEQFSRYKKIQVQDVYKLLYQGVFGTGHAINENARESFYEEFKKATPKKGTAMEKISPVFEIYRINIEPYKFFNGEKEALFELFYESSKIKTGGMKVFEILWESFKKINKETRYFPSKKVEDFEKKYLSRGQLPVMHHSKKYRKANKPSYIVVNLQKLCEDDD